MEGGSSGASILHATRYDDGNMPQTGICGQIHSAFTGIARRKWPFWAADRIMKHQGTAMRRLAILGSVSAMLFLFWLRLDAQQGTFRAGVRTVAIYATVVDAQGRL